MADAAVSMDGWLDIADRPEDGCGLLKALRARLVREIERLALWGGLGRGSLDQTSGGEQQRCESCGFVIHGKLL